MKVLVTAIVALGCSSSGTAEREPAPVGATASSDAAAPDSAAPAPAPEPPTPSFNDRVVALAEAYPTGGGYAWPAPRGTHGTGRDLFAGGERVARAAGNGSTHCSGITFELFWRALEAAPDRPSLDAAAARELMRLWYVPRDRGMGPAEALPAAGLGRRITDLEAARPGDFVQVWFNNGRGHTVVFLGWERDAGGAIVGLRHFSSHPATDGVGVDTRAIGTGPRDIRRDAIYIARAEW